MREEHRHLWDKMKSQAKTDQGKMDSERRGYEALMSHLRQKHKREVKRLNAHIADRDSELEKQAIEHKSVLDDLEKSTNQCHEERQRHRQLV